MSGDSLMSLRGIRFKETILTNTTTHYSSSRGTVSPNSSLTDSPVPLKVCGPLTLFSFVVPTKSERVSYTEQKANLKIAVQENFQLLDGLLLVTKEKGVMFPVVHMSENSDFLSSKLQNGNLGEASLGDNVTVHQVNAEEHAVLTRTLERTSVATFLTTDLYFPTLVSQLNTNLASTVKMGKIQDDFITAVYQEVRKIVPETELPQVAPFPQLQEKIGYMLLGFKSLDRNFSQVMLDTWKDWTGARYIYMYLPDDLGLRRISFYHRQLPDDLNLFMYVVLVECHGITSKEKLVQLLDFAQRMRLERLTGYISVYAGEKFGVSDSPTSPFEIPQLEGAEYLTSKDKIDMADDFFSTDSLGRNSRM